MKALTTIIFLVSISSLALGGCKIQSSQPPKVGLELVADGFTSPVALVESQDGSRRLFVVDQTGLIWILSGGKRIEKPFLDLRGQVLELNSFYDERGLVG